MSGRIAACFVVVAGTTIRGTVVPRTVFMDWWSRISKTGTVGDPTLATAEKGKIVFEAAATELVKLVREFRNWTGMPRRDMH